MRENKKRNKDKAKARAKAKAVARAKAGTADLTPEERQAKAKADKKAAKKQRKLEKRAANPKKYRRRRIIIGVVAGLIVVILAVTAWLFYRGALAPYWAAAKYDGMNYITEETVENFILSYQIQAGYANASDEEWAEYLDENGLTPEGLRAASIQQLVTTEMIQRKADEVGVELTDEEWETYLTNIKNNLAFGDDEVYTETVEAMGMTTDTFESQYRIMLLRERLYEAEVEMPEAGEDDAVSYIASNYTEDTVTKHIYYFTLSGLDEDGSYENLQYVQEIAAELEEMGLSVDNFAEIVEAYCDDDDLVARDGANGWDLDITDYSDDFQEAVDGTEVGELSDVFETDDGYGFVYIDTSFTIPAYSEDYDFSALPETLQEYFIDCAAYLLWEDDCEEYLYNLYLESNCIIYAMPEDAAYNVDMSILDDDDEEDDEDSDTDEETDDEG